MISGYRHAVTEASNYLTNTLSYKVEDLGQESLVNAASTSLSSKILGSEGLFFSRLAVDALQRVRTPAGKYPVKSVNILKAPGKGTKDSFLGMRPVAHLVCSSRLRSELHPCFRANASLSQKCQDRFYRLQPQREQNAIRCQDRCQQSEGFG